MMTVKEACRLSGVDKCTLRRMVDMGLIRVERCARLQYDPDEIRAALPEYRWRIKYEGDFTPLEKICSNCGRGLKISGFRMIKCGRSKYGYLYKKECRSCEYAAKKKPDRDRHREYQREWRCRPGVQDRIRESRRRRDAIPRRQIDRRVSKAIRESLSNDFRGGIWRESLPYSFEELKSHIERQFLKGMGWENMHLWHIDHIVPKSAFRYESPHDPDFQACWALTNLRPLWAKDNISKGAKRVSLL